MNQAITIDELAHSVCKELINAGVKEYVAWADYSRNYRPIVQFFDERGCHNYDESLLRDYEAHITSVYDEEIIVRKTFLSHRRAVHRLQEYYDTGQIRHIGKDRYAKRWLHPENEAILLKFLKSIEPLNSKTRRDIDWAIRKYLFWLELQGISCVLKSNSLQFEKFFLTTAEKESDGTIYNLRIYLRKFYLFLKDNYDIDIPYEYVLSVTVKRRKPIFTPITDEEISNTLKQVDRTTDKGKRDYAIILLGAICALRASDIVELELQDILWRKNEIHIVQKKTGEPLIVPMSNEVAGALKEYILESRHNTGSKKVFQSTVYPYRRFSDSVAICHMWRGYQKRAGIETYAHDGKGFHSLRRAMGKKLCENEIPVTTIAQVLGHESISSTRPYISVDLKHLKACALSLDGISLESEVYR